MSNRKIPFWQTMAGFLRLGLCQFWQQALPSDNSLLRLLQDETKTLLGILDWDLDVQQAINLPNITNRNDQTTVEQGRVGNTLVQGLIAMGHDVKQAELNSGIHAIEVENGVMHGGADPRREGLVLTR